MKIFIRTMSRLTMRATAYFFLYFLGMGRGFEIIPRPLAYFFFSLLIFVIWQWTKIFSIHLTMRKITGMWGHAFPKDVTVKRIDAASTEIRSQFAGSVFRDGNRYPPRNYDEEFSGLSRRQLRCSWNSDEDHWFLNGFVFLRLINPCRSFKVTKHF